MDTNEMLRIVDLIADLKPYFRGIYASNSLPFVWLDILLPLLATQIPWIKKVLTGLRFGSKTEQNVSFTTALVEYRRTMTLDWENF